jgi:hypothetical protein
LWYCSARRVKSEDCWIFSPAVVVEHLAGLEIALGDGAHLDHGAAAANMLPWLKGISFERAVVPEVCRIKATAFESGFSGGTGIPPAGASSVSPSLPPPTEKASTILTPR